MKPGIDHVAVGTPFYCTDGKGKFLLHKRSKNCRDEQGNWDVGGGRLEFGLTLQENALKEVMEEYGCKGEILEQLPAFSHLREYDGDTTHWVAIPFVIKVNPDEVRNNEPEKIDEIGWFTLDNLPTPLHSGIKTMPETHRHQLEKYS